MIARRGKSGIWYSPEGKLTVPEPPDRSVQWRNFGRLTRISLAWRDNLWHAEGYDETIMTSMSVFKDRAVAVVTGDTPHAALNALERCSYAVGPDGDLMRDASGTPLSFDPDQLIITLNCAHEHAMLMEKQKPVCRDCADQDGCCPFDGKPCWGRPPQPTTVLRQTIWRAREAIMKRDVNACFKEISDAIKIAKENSLQDTSMGRNLATADADLKALRTYKEP